MNMFDRCARISSLAIVTTLLATGLAAAQDRLRVAIIPIMDVAPLYAGIQQGFFKEENLEVVTQSTGSIGIPALVAGEFDIAYTNAARTLQAMEQGLPVKIVMPASTIGTAPPEPAAIVVRKGEGIKTAKDIEGKVLGVSARGDVNWLFSRAWIKANGGDVTKVNFREVRHNLVVDALKSKQIDAAFPIDPFLAAAQQDPNLEVIAWPFSSVMPGVQLGVYVTTAGVAEKQLDQLQRFKRAMVKANKWVNAHIGKPELMTLIEGYTKIPHAQMETIIYPRMPETPEVDLATMGKLMALMKSDGALSKDIDLKDKVITSTR